MPDRSSAVRRVGTVLALVALFVLGLPVGAQSSTYSVGVTLGSPTARVHHAVSVSGTVSGKPSGKTVYLQRKSSGKWQNVANTKLSKSGGYTTPVAVTGLTSGVVSIGAGLGFTCAVTSDGAVHCWGRNDYGGLGNGTTTASTTPVTVCGLTKMATVSVGTSTACAVSTAGAVSCWGDDGSGEIGDGGSESQAPTPVAVSGLSSGVKKVSVDSLATCALLSSGGLKCSGDGFYGELATGLQAASSNVPVDIAGFTSGVADVVVGYEHVCAVRTVGTVACWGQNDQGEDSGPNSINYSPVDVPGLSNVAAISGTGRTSCALTSAGGVFCWGAEPLGDDGQGAQNVPQPAYDLSSGATSLASGGSQRCVVMKDGSVSYWGALVPSSPGLSAQVPQPL